MTGGPDSLNTEHITHITDGIGRASCLSRTDERFSARGSAEMTTAGIRSIHWREQAIGVMNMRRVMRQLTTRWVRVVLAGTAVIAATSGVLIATAPSAAMPRATAGSWSRTAAGRRTSRTARAVRRRGNCSRARSTGWRPTLCACIDPGRRVPDHAARQQSACRERSTSRLGTDAIGYQVSRNRRARGSAGGGAAASPRRIHARVSAGSMTPSISR